MKDMERRFWLGLPLVVLVCCEQPSGPRAAKLTFVAQPGDAIVKGSINPAVRVAVQDEQGRTIPSFTGTVTVTLGLNPGGAALSGTTSVAAVGGIATFTDLSIDSIGAGYGLVATASGVPSATSRSFIVAPRLVFTVQPGDAAAAVPFASAVQVSAVDATGAPLSTFADSVSVAIGTNADFVTLAGTTTVAAVNGVATFADLSIGLGATGYTLIAWSPRFRLPPGILLTDTSSAFSVSCTTNCWVLKAPLPSTVPVAPDMMIGGLTVAAGVANGLLYAAGAGAAIYDPVADTWTPSASPPSPIASQGAVVNGVFYAVTERDLTGLTAEAYDPASNRWTASKSLGCSQPSGFFGFGVAAANGRLYALGGQDLSDIARAGCIYDPTTDAWTDGAIRPQLGYAGLAALNGVLYVVGGADYPLVSPGAQSLDLASNAWAARAPLPTARSDLAVGVLNGLLFAVGGLDAQGNALAAVEAYDPATDTWTAKTPLPIPRAGLAVAAVNGALYAVGGRNSRGPVVAVVAYKP